MVPCTLTEKLRSKYPDYLYRGVGKSVQLDVGQIFTFPSFVSTSGRLEVAERFVSGNGAIFKFKTQGSCLVAISLASHSQYPSEEEWLLAPIHSYMVQSVETENGRSIISCTVKPAKPVGSESRNPNPDGHRQSRKRYHRTQHASSHSNCEAGSYVPRPQVTAHRPTRPVLPLPQSHRFSHPGARAVRPPTHQIRHYNSAGGYRPRGPQI